MSKSQSWICTLLLACFFLSPSVRADISEGFPESRFGAPPEREQSNRPQRPDPFAAETPTDEESVSSRKPASQLAQSQYRLQFTQKAVQEVGLIAGDLGFFPKTVFVTPGIPVRLYVTGASKKPLCLMMDQFQVRRQIRSQRVEEIGFTPTTPGQYRFYCPVNGIEGVLLVKEPSYKE